MLRDPVLHHRRWVLLDDNGGVVQVEADGQGLRSRHESVGSAPWRRMFSQLAQVCVPAISDACTIDLVEEGGHRYRIRQPAENPQSRRIGVAAEPLSRNDCHRIVLDIL